MDMGKLTTIKNRIYADYFMPSRLDEYEKIIKTLIDNNYEIITVRDYYEKLKNNSLGLQNYFINRHDIDTDVATAKEFFRIEKKYNVKATYYFRLSTLDIDFMKAIEEYESEASYHFEEIATYCKKYHIKDKKTVLENLSKVKELFKQNFLSIEKKLDKKFKTVCSHGDFVNRKIGMVNHEIIKDISLREQLGIECETYDKVLMNSFDIYVSDKSYPMFYSPSSIFDYIGEQKIICMLSHPRQWRTSLVENTLDNLNRAYEGLKW